MESHTPRRPRISPGADGGSGRRGQDAGLGVPDRRPPRVRVERGAGRGPRVGARARAPGGRGAGGPAGGGGGGCAAAAGNPPRGALPSRAPAWRLDRLSLPLGSPWDSYFLRRWKLLKRLSGRNGFLESRFSFSTRCLCFSLNIFFFLPKRVPSFLQGV